MSNFHLVVEGEAGPLMLSPSGQFITPSSCPISLLVSFITANLEEARSRLDHYVADVRQEKALISECMQTVYKFFLRLYCLLFYKGKFLCALVWTFEFGQR